MSVDYSFVPDPTSKLTFEWVWRQFQKLQYAIGTGDQPLTFAAPASVSTAIGTPTGTVSDLTTLNDGNTYDVVEVSGGFDVQITFNNLRRIRGLATKVQYSGGATHIVEEQLYNYTTSSWDEFIIVATSNGQNYRYIEFPADDYLDTDGTAIVRFFHDTPATAGHDIYIDYVSLTE